MEGAEGGQSSGLGVQRAASDEQAADRIYRSHALAWVTLARSLDQRGALKFHVTQPNGKTLVSCHLETYLAGLTDWAKAVSR